MSGYIDYTDSTQIELGRKTLNLINEETGEKMKVQQVIKVCYDQKLFWKVTLADFLHVLGVLESKQLDVVIHLLENVRPSSNTYFGSQEKIAKRSGVSLATVSKVMVKLQRLGFIKQVQVGVYQLSPQIMIRGSEKKRQVLLSYFDESANIPKIEKIKRTPIIKIADGDYEMITLPNASEFAVEVQE